MQSKSGKNLYLLLLAVRNLLNCLFRGRILRKQIKRLFAYAVLWDTTFCEFNVPVTEKNAERVPWSLLNESQYEPAHEIMVLITYATIRAISPEPSMFAHMKYGSKRRVRSKIRHLAPLHGYACAFEEWVRRSKSAIISWAGSYMELWQGCAKLESANYSESRHEKTYFAICEQQRRRSACASAQSDQRLCYSLLRYYNTPGFYTKTIQVSS